MEQGKAILEMRLQRLTGMEQQKIRDEMETIKKDIAYLISIIENESILVGEVVKELEEVKATYGDDRRSKVEGAIDILTEADLIPDEEVVVTLTMKGYIKRVPLETYGVQHRGGKGKMGMVSLGESDDVVQDLFVTKNHDTLLFFTNFGRIYSLQVFELPEASRMAKGRAVPNLLPLKDGEKVVKLLTARELEGKFIVMLTKKGIIKRTNAMDFAKIRSTGIRCTTLRDGDELVFCKLSQPEDTIIIATAHGQGIRFKESEVRAMGRQAAGVIGIRLRTDDYVVGMEVLSTDTGDILFATENGYGKKVRVQDFRVAHRSGVGVRTIPADKRNGEVIGLTIVHPDSNILLIDQVGKIIRLPASEIRTMGRQAKGVRLVRLDKKQKLSSIFAFREEGPDVPKDGSDDQGGIKGAVKSEVKEEDQGVKRIVAPEAQAETLATQAQDETFEAATPQEEFVEEATVAQTGRVEVAPEDQQVPMDDVQKDTVFEFEDVVKEAQEISMRAEKKEAQEASAKEEKESSQTSVFDQQNEQDPFEGF